MIFKFISFVFLIAISLPSYNQNLVAMFKEHGKWGFMNEKGEVIIKPNYTYCRPFYSGMAKVGKIYFINLKGEKLKTKLRISDARQYSDGLVGVKISGKWGYMNAVGELVVPAKYKKITDFKNGYALVLTNKGTFVIDNKGNETEVVTGKGRIELIKNFSEGLAQVSINGLNGFVNEKGVLIIEPKYLSVGYYNNGVVWVRTKNNYIGYINKVGDWVIEPKFLGAGNFDSFSGMARIKDKNGWGYTNMEGVITNIKNVDVYKHFEDGLCLLRSTNIWGYLGPDGKWVIEPTYVAATPFKNGYARVRENGKWGVINKKGDWVIQPTYENIKSFFKAG
jgi:hypothetical protein